MAGFDDIVGQDSVIAHLKNAIKLNKVSHAYIINGEQGMGKKIIANAFSMALQCEEEGENPCMECQSCKQALSKNNPDIRWIVHEKPGVVSVEEIRKQVNSDVQIKPYKNKHKIYVIDEASKMNIAAQNAILKTIEEPPGYVVIILLTDNKEMLLPTILSRCVSVELRPVNKQVIEKYLVKNEGIADYRAKAVSSFAGGNIGKAIKMAISDDFIDLKDNVVRLARNIGRMNIADIVAAVKEASSYKDSIFEYIDLLIIWYRDILIYKSCYDENEIIFSEYAKYIREQADIITYESVENVLKELDGIKGKLKINVNFEMILELLFITMRDCFVLGRQ